MFTMVELLVISNKIFELKNDDITVESCGDHNGFTAHISMIISKSKGCFVSICFNIDDDGIFFSHVINGETIREEETYYESVGQAMEFIMEKIEIFSMST